MKRGNTIEVHNISKAFKIYGDRGFTLKEMLLFSKRRRYEIRPVIKDISFEVKQGEAIGLIGHNGCGKSTTLKMLTRIMFPDSGTIEMLGRVSSLLELGAGFHPDMTGRENIYINASIFGLTKKEIDDRLDDIIAFSELEDYIDNPVRTYSSGMYMRLAFSVAINVDADILLIDEILAVGDAGFQAKCFNRLKEIKASGVTIVIVSHSLGQIEQICEKSIWIHEGLIRAQGRPRDVHPLYLAYMAEQRQLIADKEADRKEEKERKKAKENIEEGEGTKKNHITSDDNIENDSMKKFIAGEKRWGNGEGKITDVEIIHTTNGKKGTFFTTGEDVIIRVKYALKKPIEDADIGFGFFRIDGLNCYGTNTRVEHLAKFDLDGEGEVNIEISPMLLLSGSYTLDIAIERSDGIAVDYWRESVAFNVFDPMESSGVSRVMHNWKIQ